MPRHAVVRLDVIGVLLAPDGTLCGSTTSRARSETSPSTSTARELRRIPRRWARRAATGGSSAPPTGRWSCGTASARRATSTSRSSASRPRAGSGYEGSHWVGVRRALKRLAVTRDDVFTDFGSGKGPAVLVAARSPSRARSESRSPTTSPARRGATSSARGCGRGPGSVEFVTADVLEYEIPDDLSVVYLYNPFTGLLFARFIERLLRSLERRPRPLRLVYNYPFEHDYLIASGRFRPIDLSYSYWPAWYRRPGYVILTYEVLTPDGGGYGLLPGARVPRAARALGRRARPRLGAGRPASTRPPRRAPGARELEGAASASSIASCW